jgi:hypothetical protein
VDFNLKVGFEAKDYAEVAKKEHLKPVELEIVKLNDMAVEIFSEMSQIRQREILHRATTDSNKTAVMGWSMLSLVKKNFFFPCFCGSLFLNVACF